MVELETSLGDKFLGVKAGGSLEIHGLVKHSWTKLDGTLVPKQKFYSNADESATVGGI